MTTKKLRRAELGKPDASGNYRPYVGDKRINLGHCSNVSKQEAERRLSELRTLFEKQCKAFFRSTWLPHVIYPIAVELGKTGKLIFRFSEAAKGDAKQAANEVKLLLQLRSVGIELPVDCYDTLTKAMLHTKQFASAALAIEYHESISNTAKQLLVSPDWLSQTLNLPDSPERVELRTFHQALDAFVEHKKKTASKNIDGSLTNNSLVMLDHVKRIKESEPDFPMRELTYHKLDELFARWRDRPQSKTSGKPISRVYAKKLMNTLWHVLNWVDVEETWKWELPRNSSKIKRTPPRQAGERRNRTRQIASNIYSPDDLATIAKHLDTFGKFILGISVNCGFQPSESGRLLIDDFQEDHPETGERGPWLIFDRPKTGHYGEWVLWPEVVGLTRWAINRSNQLGVSELIVTSRGTPWYRDGRRHPETVFARWWQRKPSPSDNRSGIITKMQSMIPEFPRYSIKYLRKILPHHLRKSHGAEIANLGNARVIDENGHQGKAMIDRYADRRYEALADAIRELETTFRPFLDELRICN